MENLRKEINTLIDQLIIAKEIYSTGADKVSDQPTANQMHLLAERKNIFLSELNNVLDWEINNYDLPISERIKVELDKINIEVDHLLLPINEGEVIRFCVIKEQQLIDSYERVLHLDRLALPGSNLKSILVNQLHYSMELLAELKEIKATYELELNVGGSLEK